MGLLAGHQHSSHNRYDADKYGVRTVLTIVRNPWDRVISLFHYTQYPGNFVDFVTHLETKPDRPIFQPCFYWAFGASWVGRYEELDRAYYYLAGQFQRLHFPRTLPRLHKSDRTSMTLYYRLESGLVDRVGELYAIDVATFGYEPPRL